MNREPLKIPSAFEEILQKDRSLNGAVESFVAGVTTLLDDNKLPFFPNFTDHGRDHIQRVLATELKLIPDDVLKLEILSPADMAVLICGTLLHDLAMHMRATGFLDLVNGRTEHRPIDWFDRQQDTRPPDRPWPELWEEFQREVKRFSDRDLNAILGPPSPIWGSLEIPEHPGDWTKRHYLFIGEFLRRHHARLAHEIALYGFQEWKAAQPKFLSWRAAFPISPIWQALSLGLTECPCGHALTILPTKMTIANPSDSAPSPRSTWLC